MADEVKDKPKKPLEIINGGKKDKPKVEIDDKPSMEYIYKDIADWIEGKLNSFPILNDWPFKEKFYVLNFHSEEKLKFLHEVKTADGRVLLKPVSFGTIVKFVFKKLRLIASGTSYFLSYKQTENAVQVWANTVNDLYDLPVAIAEKSFDGLTMSRLPFDLVCDNQHWREQCPTFTEILSRMSKPEQFMARIGSIFDPNCDRKQALWISGAKDCGKSQIDWLLRYIAGYDKETSTSGSYIALFEKSNPRWLALSLMGKRIASYQEASPQFLATAEFKRLTGEDMHTAEFKGGGFVNTAMAPLFFFFSNHKPDMPNKPELIERVLYCHMEPFNGQMLGESQYREKLKSELPAFLGACFDKYHELTENSPRINPGDNSDLIKITEDYDSDIMDIFHKYFKVEKGQKTLITDMRDKVETVQQRGMSNVEWSAMVKVWMDNLAIEKTRGPKNIQPRPTYMTNVRIRVGVGPEWSAMSDAT